MITAVATQVCAMLRVFSFSNRNYHGNGAEERGLELPFLSGGASLVYHLSRCQPSSGVPKGERGPGPHLLKILSLKGIVEKRF